MLQFARRKKNNLHRRKEKKKRQFALPPLISPKLALCPNSSRFPFLTSTLSFFRFLLLFPFFDIVGGYC